MLESGEARDIIEKHGPQRIIQAALKAYPDRRQELFSLINQFGIEQTARMLLGTSSQTPQPGSISVPAPATPVPTLPRATKEVSMQPSAKGLATQERQVNPVGVGSVTPQSFETKPATVPKGGVRVPDMPMSEVVTADTEAEMLQMPEPAVAPEQELPQPAIETPEPETLGEPIGPKPLPYIPPRGYSENTAAFNKLCKGYGFKPELILAIIKHESQFDPSASSTAKAKGLMQLMPDTAREMGLKVTTRLDEREMPKKNLSAGVKYLGWLKKHYDIKTVDDLLAAYNAGPGRLKDSRWKKINETARYVTNIKRTLREYKDNPGMIAGDLNKLFLSIGGL